DSLAGRDDPRLVNSFIRLLNERRRDAPAAALALGKIGAPAALEPLLAALHDPGPWLREAAVQGLAWLGDPSALPALRSLRRRSAWIDMSSGVAAACDRAIRSLEALRDAQGRELLPASAHPGRGTEVTHGRLPEGGRSLSVLPPRRSMPGRL